MWYIWLCFLHVNWDVINLYSKYSKHDELQDWKWISCWFSITANFLKNSFCSCMHQERVFSRTNFPIILVTIWELEKTGLWCIRIRSNQYLGMCGWLLFLITVLIWQSIFTFLDFLVNFHWLFVILKCTRSILKFSLEIVHCYS